MYALGGIGLLAALLSGGGLGRALLLGVLGLGAGYALNKWLLPRMNGWTQAAERFDSIPDAKMKKVVTDAAARTVADFYLFGETGGFGDGKDAVTANVATAAVNHAAKQVGSDIRANVDNDSIGLRDQTTGLKVEIDGKPGPKTEQ